MTYWLTWMTERKIHRFLMYLLRLGLWARPGQEEVAALDAAEWNELYRHAQKHTIEGIVFDGLQHLPAEMLPPRALLLKWAVRIDQIERHNRQMADVMKTQLRLFNAAGIFPVLLKGQGVAACYPQPEHRISGDVDWYFDSTDEYRRANELIRNKGVAVYQTAGWSAEYSWQGIVVEHHQRMFDIHNPFCYSYLNALQKQFYPERLKRGLGDTTLILPAPALMMLQVNVHILKHLLGFGLGMRQLCDAARVYHTYAPVVDGQELEQIYQRLGILKWVHLLHAVLLKFIGLPVTSLPFPLPEGITADWMMEEIWCSGNFGFFDDRFEAARDESSRKIWTNVQKYVRYAPMEALSFPLIQFLSRFTKS